MTITAVGLQEKVAAIVAEQLDKEVVEVEQARSFAQVGADELDCIEIVMRLEEEFGLEINDDDAENLVSVTAMVKYLKERLPSEK